MTSKERMLTALNGGIPDRLPVTIHQWQKYHLDNYMNGMDQFQAFEAVGLDASITVGYLRFPEDHWRTVDMPGEGQDCRHVIETPGGRLQFSTSSNQYTGYMVEHLIKSQADAELFMQFWPLATFDGPRLAADYDRLGDGGITRGFVQSMFQPGPWQDFCEMVGTEQAIMWAIDDPDFVHQFLDVTTTRREQFIHEQMPGLKFDLIEHGGGAASANVISPAMFDEFCVPYDRRVIDALHAVGHKAVYHTCGAMMSILDRIPANGCDASETLSPPGVGGDIASREDRDRVKRVLGSRVALIGGIDQGSILTDGEPDDVRAAVRECFETFGENGGYICSASDHFFDAPVENLKAMAEAGRSCAYEAVST